MTNKPTPSIKGYRNYAIHLFTRLYFEAPDSQGFMYERPRTEEQWAQFKKNVREKIDQKALEYENKK